MSGCGLLFTYVLFSDILREKREKSKKLHPAILDDIESYNVRDLDNAKTVVKQWMPTAEGKGVLLLPSNDL